MRDIRNFLSFASFSAAALLAVVAVVIGLSGSLAKHSVEEGRRIEAEFLAVASELDAFILENGRLPDSFEKAAWERKHSRDQYLVFWHPAAGSVWAYEQCRSSGQMASNSYILSYWRGGWMEGFASCNRRSTLTLKQESFYRLGGPLQDAGALAVASLFLVFLGVKLGPNPSFKRTPYGAA